MQCCYLMVLQGDKVGLLTRPGALGEVIISDIASWVGEASAIGRMVDLTEVVKRPRQIW